MRDVYIPPDSGLQEAGFHFKVSLMAFYSAIRLAGKLIAPGL